MKAVTDTTSSVCGALPLEADSSIYVEKEVMKECCFITNTLFNEL